MHKPDVGPARFYFSLPRLVAQLRGRNSARIEDNWIEANVAGTAVILISFLSVVRLLLSGFPWWQQFALFLPILGVVCLGWAFWLCLQSLVIRLLRLAGVMRDLPQPRAQTILIGVTTSAWACAMLQADTWSRLLGAAWLTAVVLNLIAAAILALSSGIRVDD